MCGIWMCLLSAVGVLITPGVYHVMAIEVSTAKEVTVVNGTKVVLKCNFKSTHPISANLLSVTWSFRPLGETTEEMFFYFLEKAYPTPNGRFTGHVTWTGNIAKNDASITLQNVQFSFNGTYSCQVRNPPDVHGYAGETSLRVVQSVKLSEISILAAAVGGAILLIIIIFSVFLVVRYCRRKREDSGVEMDKTEWKQPTSVW